VQIRRLTAAAVAGLALAGLAGCRTAPNVAAYVGDERVTVSELDRAVEERMSDPAIEQFAAQDTEAYARQVLGYLVEDEVHAAAAERYGVRVTDAQVRARLGEIFAGQDPAEAYAGLAAQGLSRQDAFGIIRQQLVRQAIAEEEGLDDALSDAALRQRYDQALESRTTIDLGVITVQDQATADRIVAALDADPGRYAALAQKYAGETTLPAIQEIQSAQLPQALAEQVAAAEPGKAFSVAVPEFGGGVTVGLLGPDPTFQELEPQLVQQAQADVDKAAQPLVKEVRDDLGVTVNPRYGELEDDGTIDTATDGPVKFLEG
jgi:peptidyl-prolyl cis-trans isomerase SurA